ncbi:MAG: hypothetical protein KDD45_08615 [Bdellovibrionales bacterium]|nr:hypothetical protein [Bdellovibrionales bacterium]
MFFLLETVDKIIVVKVDAKEQPKAGMTDNINSAYALPKVVVNYLDSSCGISVFINKIAGERVIKIKYLICECVLPIP